MTTVGEANVNEPKSESPPVILATDRYHTNDVQLLVDNDVLRLNREILHQTPLHNMQKREYKDCVDFLLSARSNPSYLDKQGNTGLHHSPTKGSESID